MTTSLTTFKSQVRERLLDVLYAQWTELGVPFATNYSFSQEVIDPEALLWCSLEFLSSEPRLFEGVSAWLNSYRSTLSYQRVAKYTKEEEFRALLWKKLTRVRQNGAPEPNTTNNEPLKLEVHTLLEASKSISKEAGLPTDNLSTIVLRSRDLLGGGPRHFLLVYLLANSNSGKLRTVEK